MGKTITVSKLDAAKRQTQTALELWFADRDPVAVHTLAFASHEIIHRLYKLAGHKTLLFDVVTGPKEAKIDYARMVKHSGNFFKHAKIEREHATPLEFDPIWNEIFLGMSLTALKTMGETMSVEAHAFMVWLFTRHPNWFSEAAKSLVPTNMSNEVREIPKAELLEVAHRHFKRLEASR